MANQDETAHEVTVSVGGTTVAVTTTTFTYSPQSSESVMNDSPNPSTTYTYWYAEGSMEWDGSQVSVEEAFIQGNGAPVPKSDIQLRIQDTEVTHRCSDVTIQGLDRDYPADGATSGTLDWKADSYARD